MMIMMIIIIIILLNLYPALYVLVQKAELLTTCHIVRKFLAE